VTICTKKLGAFIARAPSLSIQKYEERMISDLTERAIAHARGGAEGRDDGRDDARYDLKCELPSFLTFHDSKFFLGYEL
jgi:hypothetical protein